MKRKFVATEVSIILLNNADLLTASGEDDALVKDGSWVSGISTLLGLDK